MEEEKLVLCQQKSENYDCTKYSINDQTQSPLLGGLTTEYGGS